MTFVGRTPVAVRARPGRRAARRRPQLAELLRAQDVYLAASRDDPCSNALLEALACGLPAVFRRSGGHPELVGEARARFDEPEELAGRCSTRLVRRSWTSGARRSACRAARRRGRPLSRGAARLSALAHGARRLGGRCAASPSASRTAAGTAHSRLFVVGDRVGWSVDEDAAHIAAAARRLGYDVAPPAWARPRAGGSPSSSRATSRRCTPRWLDVADRLGARVLARPARDAGHAGVRPAFEALRAHPDRVRAGAGDARGDARARARGRRRPSASTASRSAIDLERFPLGDAERAPRRARGARAARAAFVVGSFQKDGVGWGEGLEPKLVKGPDVLVARARAPRAPEVPELFVLLTGPARGYVRRELERLGIPYRHVLARDAGRARARLPRARPLPRHLAAGGRAEGGARVARRQAFRS